ncbi:alpha-E domain-containing protein [Nocardioides bruguierae]|uniref:Alpha-E domain-containing protein n=1 Tax=Nocardioides bruguierae TaxID=2945102 RepID=A0A9X2ID75_9ACTN|nr:alpha-E domain-containing protein [Nocardioides bruguierae]MCL8026383.1 alpha-E domain-containing protein [Nocardioides bruguierae]MCM0619446.1 alpha-E domain-containing protein [Nocardioides bruguierae]
MLSRIAESMFWIGRYVERAEDTAQLLDVQSQLLLEDATLDENATCRDLLNIMGAELGEHEGPLGLGAALHMLCYDSGNPSSIAASLEAARESARRARETLSVAMWEAINTTYRAIPSGHFGRMRAPGVFSWVRDRVSLVNGIADGTMTRDESWQFMVLGRSVERADMTSRLVASASLASGSETPWTTTLRASGSYDAFLRTYRGVETERAAAEFLLLDRLFPRSVVYSLQRAEQCLQNLESADPRAGFQNEAQRLLGRMRAELEYRSPTELMTDLPTEMERLQRTCAAATEAVTRRYFAGAEATSWTGVSV